MWQPIFIVFVTIPIMQAPPLACTVIISTSSKEEYVELPSAPPSTLSRQMFDASAADVLSISCVHFVTLKLGSSDKNGGSSGVMDVSSSNKRSKHLFKL